MGYVTTSSKRWREEEELQTLCIFFLLPELATKGLKHGPRIGQDSQISKESSCQVVDLRTSKQCYIWAHHYPGLKAELSFAGYEAGQPPGPRAFGGPAL